MHTSPPPDVAETLPQDEAERGRARELSREADQPPAEVPGFRVQKKIGEGRFGSVWLAREHNTGKQVAIKFYAQRRGVDWSLLGREVEKLAVLYTSRNIVGLLHVGWDHDPPYYVMEYLASGSLADRLVGGPLPVAEAVRIATRLSQALVHAHGSGILHCDLKPANVLLDQDGEPRLCDFGQSRLADERSGALGTLFYMAPEQADLKGIPDARWDVYGLGALLYHMVTGTPPYRSPEAEEKLHAAGSLEDQLTAYRKIVTQSPRPTLHRRAPGIDAPLIDIIDKCLAPSASRRLPNAQAVLDRLADRERQRSRRPLMLLGLVLPLLLALFITPLATNAMHDAVSTARFNLAQRALESDVLTVNLLSSSLQRELVDRREQLLQIAEDEAFRTVVAQYARKPREDRGELMDLLNAKYDRIQQRREELVRSPDASWFLMDATGYQRWHRDGEVSQDPQQPMSKTVDQNFAFRDYFHGRNEAIFETNAPTDLAPIRAPHVSRTYLSTSSGRFRVAISVPIWDLAEEHVIGVLARSIYVSDLLMDYERSVVSQGNDSVGRVLALIDSRDWKLIAHSDWQQRADTAPLVPDEFEKLRLSPEMIDRLQGLIDLPEGTPATSDQDRMSNYTDPMREIDPDQFGGLWLAAFSPVGETGWVAVVQERRAAAFAAVDELRTRMVWFGITAIAIVVLLVAGCWWLIIRIVNNRPLFWWPMGSASGMPSLTSTLSGTTRGNDRV